MLSYHPIITRYVSAVINVEKKVARENGMRDLLCEPNTSTSPSKVEYLVEKDGVGRSGQPSSGHWSEVAGSQMSHRVARGLS